MNNNVFIFDIDGCIMPNIFKNYDWADNQDKETVIREVNKNGGDVPLYPNFIEYYKTSCKDALKIYFITGRQEEEYKDLTLKNLEELFNFEYDFTIIWYPPNKKHKAKIYFNWKFNRIKRILRGYEKSSRKYGLKLSYYIYDDWTDYFPQIEKYIKKHKISYFLGKRQSNEEWMIKNE